MNIEEQVITDEQQAEIQNLLGKYTGASALMEALTEAGVSNIFANLGSDHPAIIESWAQAKLQNKEIPNIIICPHEFVAISAAHGYAQVTGKAQAVIVHVDCGTQNLGGGIHNAAVGRVPIFIFAGASPFTQDGEMLGGRNEFIHWLQDVSDQRGIVREYVKYDNEVRTGKNIKQLVHRSLQISQSEPKGPVYLMAAREALEESVEPVKIDVERWGTITPLAVHPDVIKELGEDLLQAKKPLIVTSFLGRNNQAVDELVKLSETLAIPVIESSPNYVNFPANHPLHVGYQWNAQKQNDFLAQADLILILDSDVPWIPLVNKPASDCKIYYVDIDPLKENTPLWYIPSKRFIQADSYTALQQLNGWLEQAPIKATVVEQRYTKYKIIHDKQRQGWKKEAQLKKQSVITAEFLIATLNEVVDDDTIILNEAITNYENVCKHLGRSIPGTYFASGASSLGWNGGAAIGAKLAAPEKTIISLTGDGTYMFSNPTPVHWVAKKYNTPFLTIVFNNKGWGAPRQSTLGVHPNGLANATDQFWVNFDSTVEYAKVAEAAGGAYARKVEKPSEVREVLIEALEIVRSGRSVVLDVAIPQVSNQMI
ncbi:MAG: thiamine pyrophosphate-requiring protein [Solibacillus sp.]